jgi:hypothetical protein
MTATTTPLRGYQADIARATGVTDPGRLGEIEQLMRIDHRTLDGLTAAQFTRLARRAADELDADALAAVPRKVGDLVGCSRLPGCTYRIKSVNDQTYRIKDVDTGAEIRASKSLVTDPPARTGPAPSKATAAGRAPAAYWTLGTLLRWNGPKTIAGVTPGGLCVVLRDKGDTVNAARLGGIPGNRYIKAPHGMFEVIDPSAIEVRG